MTSTLDSDCQLALMVCTSAGYSARENFSSLGDEAAELLNILVINVVYLINTEAAYLLAALTATTAIVSFCSACLEGQVVVCDLLKVTGASAAVSRSRSNVGILTRLLIIAVVIVVEVVPVATAISVPFGICKMNILGNDLKGFALDPLTVGIAAGLDGAL